MFPNCFPQWLKSLLGSFQHVTLDTKHGKWTDFFFGQTSKSSYCYLQQSGTDMTILHLPDGKILLSKATCSGLPLSETSTARLPGRRQNPHLSKLSL